VSSNGQDRGFLFTLVESRSVEIDFVLLLVVVFNIKYYICKKSSAEEI